MNRPNDNIILENKYKFSTHTSVSLDTEHRGDYNVTLEFFGLDLEKFKEAVDLYHAAKSLLITSEVIAKNGYDITNIVVRSMNANDSLAMVWICTSDVPFDLNSIE